MSFKSLLGRQPFRIAVFSSLVLLAACGNKEPQAPAGGMKVPVSVITVQPTSTELFSELPGRVEAIKDAQIRARVSGIVEEINFEQGAEVKQDQLLFTIDPAPYRAVRNQAAAQLKNAQADAQSARQLAQRYERLIKENAVSRQDYDNAKARAMQAEASIAAAQAALESATIDLGYTKVVSPVAGRIGRALITEGALVSATNATHMATVQQLDRVYIDVTRSTAELSQLRRAMADGSLKSAGEGQAKAKAVLEDGSLYDQDGVLLFSGVSVDPSTSQVTLRAVFPNPDEILLPGMYVRLRLEQGVIPDALLVPAQAVQYTSDGSSNLYVVRDGKAQSVPVVLGPEHDGQYVVNKGLQAGDQIIVEGFQKIRPGAPVQTIPWKGDKPAAAPASDATPAQQPAAAAEPNEAKSSE
ncbi:efflux RND transporter periplasmic adaptor subunit [Alcaligenes ammonioxydans]|uniref:Efflux RND transporter periplasmic adaptor subunit n=1 Tax=Alcaligenes ammonioxydans TaxID=2582914 RepID=A0ABX8SVX3_9BURK|nr:efflux RND transporter periplasmic adaptor subunit [Alcaligenes ammonioxydans]EJC65511.1 multidrug efflux system inner membrane protein [Alcaligenes faecalis subsp. faecalis NCIB 8687]QBH18121.1 efflux RND transporter periplasmic adaptor subunit [Alcaligenes faecalis]MCH1878360.1 efflux RND transporter periplasmic adaptor subunit [Alcaligenes ammonioxydans]QXX79272.1 efflux RND transporter periplasmic adaptor subunit [Alcaligenes ammonioxydans]WGQ34184.1 efflux RND transporter periplasmic a